MSKLIALARKAAELGQKEEAQKAYTMVLQQAERTPEEELEAATYILFSKGEYRVSYTTFVSLHQRGKYRRECFDILTQAFYEPNRKLLESRYEKNCKLLKKYPYLFRQDFLPFQQLPIRFYPYDDKGYVPFDMRTGQFGEYVNVNHPVVSRNFFANLDDPILAEDVFSQYELEYLYDNVRKSEWVGRENHIYLHYTDWAVFCAYLQCFNLRPLLEEEKLIFLIEGEIAQYPIDFQKEYGIDYSQYPVKPVGIREVNRLIWHTQLSAHNGGDFFNEILYDHPNVLSYESIMYDNLLDVCTSYQTDLNQGRKVLLDGSTDPAIALELNHLSHVTVKDILVGFFLGRTGLNQKLDRASRIVPALLMQPHFYNITFDIRTTEKTDVAVLRSEELNKILSSPLFHGFKYIKTFTPMRRPTTSYGATIRFMLNRAEEDKILGDELLRRAMNRSYMVDWQNRIFQDSILVRFEDGKLNPKATFTALAQFLDIPYTESMTYCSGATGINPESSQGNVLGFDPATVYRTYDEYADDAERALLEGLWRDVYAQYGYEFQYYDGEATDEAWLKKTLERCDCLYEHIRKRYPQFYQAHVEKIAQDNDVSITADEESMENSLQEYLDQMKEKRADIAQVLLKSPVPINQNGQPLRFMKKLELDPALLEQPLYH